MYRSSSNNPWRPSKGLNTGSFAQIGGTEPVGNRFQGMLGQTIVLSNANALKDSDTSVGTLYEGVYQLVKATSTLVRGQLVFWDTLANNGINDFEVTSTVGATSAFRAGVAICAATSGEYVYIQIAGLASVLFGNSAVGGIGLGVIQATALDTPLLTVNTVNTVAAATAWTSTFTLAFVGLAYEAPTTNTISRVLLNVGGFYQNIPS